MFKSTIISLCFLVAGIANAASIELSIPEPWDGNFFENSTHSVPSHTESAEDDLIYLSWEAAFGVCYKGDVRNVIASIDRVVKKASNVYEYERSSKSGVLYLNLSVKNKGGKRHVNSGVNPTVFSLQKSSDNSPMI